MRPYLEVLGVPHINMGGENSYDQNKNKKYIWLVRIFSHHKSTYNDHTSVAIYIQIEIYTIQLGSVLDTREVVAVPLFIFYFWR